MSATYPKIKTPKRLPEPEVFDVFGMPQDLHLAAVAGTTRILGPERPPITTARSIYAIARGLEALPVEQFVAFMLDRRAKVIAAVIVSRGGFEEASVDIRALFCYALTARASAMILAHNHPSGDPTPGDQDHSVTARLVGCAKIIGIPILDHIVVGGGRYWSMHEHGFNFGGA